MFSSGIEQMASYTQTNRLVNTPTPSGYTHFEHDKNIIGRPEAPERSEQLGNWETLGVAAPNVLWAIGRP